ncbi:MAG: 50S ribosomal protein L13 [Anaerolineales bacterium]|nr:50S ribosomal protein L13 [Anaerolineales bacterium]
MTVAANKTFVTKASDIQREWVVVDAAGQNLGRLATKVAALLRGKHRPYFSPALDTGDFVIVINAEKITVTGGKMIEKEYYDYSGFPGGLRITQLKDQLAKHPDRVITHAVKGMLPHTKLGRAIIKKLKVYAGPEHPHKAQTPKKLD